MLGTSNHPINCKEFFLSQGDWHIVAESGRFDSIAAKGHASADEECSNQCGVRCASTPKQAVSQSPCVTFLLLVADHSSSRPATGWLSSFFWLCTGLSFTRTRDSRLINLEKIEKRSRSPPRPLLRCHFSPSRCLARVTLYFCCLLVLWKTTHCRCHLSLHRKKELPFATVAANPIHRGDN